MLTAKRLEIELALPPLLSRRFELIEFDLVDPVIALESNARAIKTGNPHRRRAPAPPPGAPTTAMAFGVGNVEITNGSLTYRDGGSGDVTRVTASIGCTSAPALGGADCRGIPRQGQQVPLTVEGTLGPLEALLQKRWPYPVNLQGEVAGRKAALATKVRAEDTKYTFDELRIVLGANALTGSLAAVTGGARDQARFRP
jgi:uncharacterized protein involved in outer membrane biogenesis